MQETITPKRQFLRTASSDSLNLPNGRLRKASLFCIKNCRFRGAVQFWPGDFEGMRAKTARQSRRIAGLCACVRCQSRWVSAPARLLPGPSSHRACPLRISAAYCAAALRLQPCVHPLHQLFQAAYAVARLSAAGKLVVFPFEQARPRGHAKKRQGSKELFRLFHTAGMVIGGM